MTDKKVLKKIIEGYISDSVQSPEVQIDTLRAENVALRARYLPNTTRQTGRAEDIQRRL